MSLAPEAMLLAVAPRCGPFPRMGGQLMGREANAMEHLRSLEAGPFGRDD